MTEQLFMGISAVRAGGGKFDSTKRYLRAGASGARFPIAQNRTLDISGDPSPIGGAACRYSIGGYVREQTTWTGGDDPDAGNYNAAHTLVKL